MYVLYALPAAVDLGHHFADVQRWLADIHI
jgi:hypothetical protein